MSKPITSFRFVTSSIFAESRIGEAEPINLRILRVDVDGVARKNSPSRAARQAVRPFRFRRSRSEVFCSMHSGKKTLTEPFRGRYYGFASAADYQLCFKAMRHNYSTALKCNRDSYTLDAMEWCNPLC